MFSCIITIFLFYIVPAKIDIIRVVLVCIKNAEK